MNHTTRKWSLRFIVIFYLGLLVGLPVVYLFVKAFSNGFHAFWVEVSKPDAIAALKLSAEVALIAVPVNTVVGVGAALLLAKRKFPGSRALQVAFDIPVAVSPIIIGVALILAYSRIGWFGAWLSAHGIQILFSPIGIVMATMAVSLPYVLRSVLPVLVEVGKDQEDAARTLGAGPFRTFWQVTLPAIRWGVLYGVTLTIARTLGEFGAVLVVSGDITGKTQTLPIYIFAAWDQNFDTVGAFAGAVVLASISIVALIILSTLRARER
ncbi:MAG: sulfate ABC transporter permease subunit, partial [Acidimicrobiales bacterium]